MSLLLSLLLKSCLTCDPMDCSPRGCSVHGISQARILEWVDISSCRGSSQPRDQTHISFTGRWSLYHWATRETPNVIVVAQLLSHVWLCDPMDCSTPGFPVLHYLPEFAQTYVRWIGDAIQPSHPLPPSSPPALNLSQHQVIVGAAQSEICGVSVGDPGESWCYSLEFQRQFGGRIPCSSEDLSLCS